MKKTLLCLIFVSVLFARQLFNAQTVTIGTQVWTTKNLDVKTFRNGEAIPEAKTKEEWVAAGNNKQAAWCYYDNDAVIGTKYGILYNWYAVNDPRGLAPAGYHIPSDVEWTTLSDFLGGEDVAGEKMKSMSGWEENGNGTIDSRFSGLPGGYRCLSGNFYYVGLGAYWWSSTEEDDLLAWYLYLNYDGDVLNRYGYQTRRERGFSVRCIEGEITEFPKGIDPAPKSSVEQDEEKSEPVETLVEEEPDFPGGYSSMAKYINDNIEYPQEAIDLAIKGRVTLRFVVEKDGRISNVSVQSPLPGCKACDKAAVKVVLNMPPWSPGKISGRAVRTWVTLPIKFEVLDVKPKKRRFH